MEMERGNSVRFAHRNAMTGKPNELGSVFASHPTLSMQNRCVPTGRIAAADPLAQCASNNGSAGLSALWPSYAAQAVDGGGLATQALPLRWGQCAQVEVGIGDTGGFLLTGMNDDQRRKGARRRGTKDLS